MRYTLFLLLLTCSLHTLSQDSLIFTNGKKEKSLVLDSYFAKFKMDDKKKCVAVVMSYDSEQLIVRKKDNTKEGKQALRKARKSILKDSKLKNREKDSIVNRLTYCITDTLKVDAVKKVVLYNRQRPEKRKQFIALDLVSATVVLGGLVVVTNVKSPVAQYTAGVVVYGLVLTDLLLSVDHLNLKGKWKIKGITPVEVTEQE